MCQHQTKAKLAKHYPSSKRHFSLSVRISIFKVILRSKNYSSSDATSKLWNHACDDFVTLSEGVIPFSQALFPIGIGYFVKFVLLIEYPVRHIDSQHPEKQFNAFYVSASLFRHWRSAGDVIRDAESLEREEVKVQTGVLYQHALTLGRWAKTHDQGDGSNRKPSPTVPRYRTWEWWRDHHCENQINPRWTGVLWAGTCRSRIWDKGDKTSGQYS